MAKGASKKTHAQNQKTLELLKNAFLGVNAYFVLVRLMYQYNSLTFWSILGYLCLLSSSWTIYFQLVSSAQPRFSEGRLVSSGDDLSAKGLTSYACFYYSSITSVFRYMFDILYVTWFVQVTTTISNYFWYFYLLVPGYATYKFVTLALLPFLRSRNSSNNANFNNGGSASVAVKENLSNRANKAY